MILKAIKVKQPLGEFYIAKIKAVDLLRIAYTEQFRYDKDGRQVGTQRKRDEKRLKEISNFIKSEEMSFPSSILIAINKNVEGFEQGTDEDIAEFKIHKIMEDVYDITIPDTKKCAMIIDGQHRLFSFEQTGDNQKEIELVCSIFFDLPNPYQAYLFATINGNQKRVDKSQSLELFGYNVEDEPSDQWTPEKLAVYLTRKLNFKNDSPLYHQLKLAAAYDDDENDKKLASTAAMAEGILTLISNNAKRDRDIISATKNSLFRKRSRYSVSTQRDLSPLRKMYIDNKDQEIYEILVAFFGVVERNIWSQACNNSVIRKTIGVLALFDLLKNIIKITDTNNLTDKLFDSYIKKFEFIDFSNNYFSTSGLGQGRIKRIIKYLANITSFDTLKQEDVHFLQNSCNGHFILLEFIYRVAYDYTVGFYSHSSINSSDLDIDNAIYEIVENLHSNIKKDHIIMDVFGNQFKGEEDFYDMIYEYVTYSDIESKCKAAIQDAVLKTKEKDKS
mgnify:CR=1 FL=1